MTWRKFVLIAVILTTNLQFAMKLFLVNAEIKKELLSVILLFHQQIIVTILRKRIKRDESNSDSFIKWILTLLILSFRFLFCIIGGLYIGISEIIIDTFDWLWG